MQCDCVTCVHHSKRPLPASMRWCHSAAWHASDYLLAQLVRTYHWIHRKNCVSAIHGHDVAARLMLSWNKSASITREHVVVSWTSSVDGCWILVEVKCAGQGGFWRTAVSVSLRGLRLIENVVLCWNADKLWVVCWNRIAQTLGHHSQFVWNDLLNIWSRCAASMFFFVYQEKSSIDRFSKHSITSAWRFISRVSQSYAAYTSVEILVCIGVTVLQFLLTVKRLMQTLKYSSGSRLLGKKTITGKAILFAWYQWVNDRWCRE